MFDQCFVEIGIGLPFLLMVDLKRGEDLRGEMDAFETSVAQTTDS